MSSTSNYTTGSTPCMPGRNVMFSNLDVCEDAAVDGNLEVNTINGLPYPPGGGFLPVPVPNKILRTDGLSVVSWGDVNPSNLVGGAVNDVLKTVAPGVVAWDPVKPVDMTPGTARQLFQTNAGGTAAEWTSNVDIPGTLDVTGQTHLDAKLFVTGGAEISTGNFNVITGDIVAINGDLEIQTGAATIAGNINNAFGATATFTNVDIAGNLLFNSVSGTSGQYLKKTGASTQAFSDFAGTDIKGGTLGQVLQSDGTSGVFNTNVTIPGKLTSTDTFTASASTNLVGNLQFNGVTGATGQYVKKTGPATQAFSSFVVGDITPGSNGQIITTSGGVSVWASPSVLTLAMRFYNNTPRNVNTGTNIFATNGVTQYNTGSPFTFNVGTGTFACNITGTYTWTFATILDTHDAQSKFIISDGTTIQCAQQTDYVAGLTTAQPFSYTGTFSATLGQVWSVSFASFGVGGVMNSSGQDATFLCPTTTLDIVRV